MKEITNQDIVIMGSPYSDPPDRYIEIYPDKIKLVNCDNVEIVNSSITIRNTQVEVGDDNWITGVSKNETKIVATDSASLTPPLNNV